MAMNLLPIAMVMIIKIEDLRNKGGKIRDM